MFGMFPVMIRAQIFQKQNVIGNIWENSEVLTWHSPRLDWNDAIRKFSSMTQSPYLKVSQSPSILRHSSTFTSTGAPAVTQDVNQSDVLQLMRSHVLC